MLFRSQRAAANRTAGKGPGAQQAIDNVAKNIGLPTGLNQEQFMQAYRKKVQGQTQQYAQPAAPVTENIKRKVDDNGRTQEQWIKAVKKKFPEAKIMQAKMFDGPCFALLPNGKKLSWIPVQGVAEGAIPEDMFRTKAEVENPVDSVKLDIPLLIRIMEYAREDAKTDLDLHDIAERLISIGRSGNTLSMRDYDRIVGKEARPMLTNKQ